MHTADKHPSTSAPARTRSKYRLNRARPGPDPMDTVSLNGDRVCDFAGEEIGRIEGVLLDGSRNRIMYAVLSFGGWVGRDSGDNRLFAVPWSVLRLNADDACVILEVSRERLKAAPGFERDQWPSITDRGWRDEIDAYYGVRPQRGRRRAAPVEGSRY